MMQTALRLFFALLVSFVPSAVFADELSPAAVSSHPQVAGTSGVQTPPTEGARTRSESPSAQTSAAADSALTNDDIVKLSKLGLGDEVIIAKIGQAKKVDFKLGTDDLVKLNGEGVSRPIIRAMLDRTTAPAEPIANATASAESVPEAPKLVQGPMGLEAALEVGTVKLSTKDKGELDLTSIAGSMSTTWAYVTALVHMDYTNSNASVRTRDRQPSLLVSSAKSPMGRYYIVRADSDDDDEVRSVKLGNTGMFTAKNMGAPDKDDQVPYDVKEESQGKWRLTPRKELKPGEYGLWIPTTEIYDFGVDK